MAPRGGRESDFATQTKKKRDRQILRKRNKSLAAFALLFVVWEARSPTTRRVERASRPGRVDTSGGDGLVGRRRKGASSATTSTLGSCLCKTRSGEFFSQGLDWDKPPSNKLCKNPHRNHVSHSGAVTIQSSCTCDSPLPDAISVQYVLIWGWKTSLRNSPVLTKSLASES